MQQSLSRQRHRLRDNFQDRSSNNMIGSPILRKIQEFKKCKGRSKLHWDKSQQAQEKHLQTCAFQRLNWKIQEDLIPLFSEFIILDFLTSFHFHSIITNSVIPFIAAEDQ